MMPTAAKHHNAGRDVAQHTRRTSRIDYQYLYGRRWKAARLRYLQSNPLCVACKPRTQAATVVDHIKDHKGNAELFWDTSNWQPLCKSCHDRKTGIDHGYGSNKRK